MNPYRLKNVFEYLTSNNQLLKNKLKLGTDDIPIPPKRDDVTTIEAINRFNKANPRVDTTNLKPLSVKHSNVRQSNVNEPNEGVIQGAFDTATREAQSEGFPAPNYEKFKARYLKRNMKADGGMLVKPSDDGSRPGYAKDKAPIGSEIRKITKKTSPYYGKWAYRVIENGERVTKYSDIKPKSPDTSPKHPYVNSKDFQIFFEEYKKTL